MNSANGTSKLSAAPAATTATACGRNADFPNCGAEETSRYLAMGDEWGVVQLYCFGGWGGGRQLPAHWKEMRSEVVADIEAAEVVQVRLRNGGE